MSNPSGFLIRDGLKSDIPDCLELDHTYASDFVWQMNAHEETGEIQVRFKTEHLPRPMEVHYPADEKRLLLSLPAEQCFLVATDRDQSELFGYLTMRPHPLYPIAIIHDVVVSRPYRRRGIGTRLLRTARLWAVEQAIDRMTAETRTRNYPAIQFFQRAGFTFAGYNDQYFPDQDIALFFSRSLR